MRELIFALDYEPGSNTLADTLADHPDAKIRSLSLHATAESLWRVGHATGSSDALAAIKDVFLTTDYYADCLATEECDADSRTQILEHTDDMLVLYSYWERTPSCTSVPHIALECLGDRALFEMHHEQRRYRWRVIYSEEGDVRAFLDKLEHAVADCAAVEMLCLADVSSTSLDGYTDMDGLPPEQSEAFRAAVEHGYYETPRAIDLGELAEKLDIPRSTLTYRVRRAEGQIAKQFVETER
ncbi:helix-turn-helix domain-containing protein [Saliphagus infecundisoli]|uniref:Helix-turn-helix domain-containing protein n=1 Tax=Saliphagus infecundisoli TaxID=1849069 RepID=A0ABD5QCL8_9EURY|nr:helix-turn-helix domain-containing protein [Saliphagus infecundisoli]